MIRRTVLGSFPIRLPMVSCDIPRTSPSRSSSHNTTHTKDSVLVSLFALFNMKALRDLNRPPCFANCFGGLVSPGRLMRGFRTGLTAGNFIHVQLPVYWHVSHLPVLASCPGGYCGGRSGPPTTRFAEPVLVGGGSCLTAQPSDGSKSHGYQRYRE
jgi:hypothetical protein